MDGKQFDQMVEISRQLDLTENEKQNFYLLVSCLDPEKIDYILNHIDARKN
jgi:hypothetical protein